MKIHELRVGNLVSQNNNLGYVYSIESAMPRKEERFSDKDLVTLFDNGLTTVPIEEIKPVVLTEERLVNLGFVTDKIEWWNGTMVLGIFKDGLYYCPTENLGYRVDKEIKYVHQLQNLYFELYGKELKLKQKL